MSKPKLVATSKPGEHKVIIYKKRYTKVFTYARVRKATFVEQPDNKHFMAAIFRIAHNILKENADKAENSQLWES